MRFFNDLLQRAHHLYFNIYDLLLLITFSLALTFFIIIISRKNSGANLKSLAYFVLFVGLGQLNFYLTYSIPIHTVIAEHLTLHFFSFTTWPFFFQGVLLLIFLKFTIEKTKTAVWVGAIASVPYLILLLWNPVMTYGRWLEDVFWRDYVLSGTVGFLVSFFYGLLCFRLLFQYNVSQQRISGKNHGEFNRAKVITIGFSITWFTEIISPFLFGNIHWTFHQIIIHGKTIATFSLTSYIFFSTLIKKPVTQDNSERREIASTDTHQAHKIRCEMKSKEYFRNSNLNIEKFSHHINIPAREVSRIINQHYQKNFYEFVNDFRIQEAKRLLGDAEWQKRSIQCIYEKAGFRSKSSFNTVFKKQVGVTPSSYRKSHSVQTSQTD